MTREIRKISSAFFALLLHESNLFDNSSLIDSYLTQIFELSPGIFGFCVGEHWVPKIKKKQIEEIQQLANDGNFYISMDPADKTLTGFKVEDLERAVDFKEFQQLPDPKSVPVFFKVQVSVKVQTATYVPRDKNEVTPPAEVLEEPKPQSRPNKPTKSINLFELIHKTRNTTAEQPNLCSEANERRTQQTQHIKIRIHQQNDFPTLNPESDTARLLSETSNSKSPFQHVKGNSIRAPSYLNEISPMAESLLGQINSKINLHLPFGVKRIPLKQPMSSKRRSIADAGIDSSSVTTSNELGERERNWNCSELPESTSHFNGSACKPTDRHPQKPVDENESQFIASRYSHNNTDFRSVITSQDLETTPVNEKKDLSPDISNISPASRSLRPSIRVVRLKRDLIPLQATDFSSNQGPDGLGLDPQNRQLIRSRPSLFSAQSNRRAAQESDPQSSAKPNSPVSSSQVDTLRIDLKKCSLIAGNESLPNMRYGFDIALEKKKSLKLKRILRERNNPNPSRKQYSLKSLSSQLKYLKPYKKAWSVKKSTDKHLVHHPATSITSQLYTENPLSSPKNVFEKKGRKEFSLFPKRLENSTAKLDDEEDQVPQNSRIMSRETIRELSKQKSLIIRNWDPNTEAVEQRLNRGEQVRTELIQKVRNRNVRFRGTLGTSINHSKPVAQEEPLPINL